MSFLIKSLFVVAVLGGGSYFAIHQIPSLKANIIEYANPRVKEARLLKQLDTTLNAVASATSTVAAKQEAITKAKQLTAEIADINADNSTFIATMVEKAGDVASAVAQVLPESVGKYLPVALIASTTPAPTGAPAPAVIASPCPTR
jgi:hypothetical protein